MFLISCCLLGISVNNKMNETKYIPKSKQSRIFIWLTKLINYIGNKANYIMDRVYLKIILSHRTRWKLTQKLKVQRKASRKIGLGMSAMAYQSKIGTYTNNIRFDTDSAQIGIDNRCTACISHVAQDFIGPLMDSARTIKGFAGSRTSGVKVGTLVWRWEDNDGKISKFTIPN